MTGKLLPLLTAFGVSLALVPVTMWLARRLGITAKPAIDRWSRREVPLLGGAAIHAAFLAGVLIGGVPAAPAAGILAGATLLFATGIVDDVVRLRPATKLVAQVVAAALVVALGVEARFTESRLVTIPVTIVWIVGITNAFNLIDNMDGLCAGVGVIAGGALAGFALGYAGPPFEEMSRLALAVAGAQAGFLVYNFNPARSFMGDAGALPTGFTLGAVAILGTYHHAGSLLLITAVPFFVLAVPIFDTAFVTVMRKFHRRKVSQGGKDHLSHRLVAIGMSERRAVLVLWGICGSLAALGLAFQHLSLYANLFLMGLAVVAVAILAIVLGEVAIYRRAEGPEEGAAGEELRRTFLNYLRGATPILLDLFLVCLAWIAAHLLMFEGRIPPFERELMLTSLPVLIIAHMVLFRLFRLYRGMWRYFGIRDLLGVLQSVGGGTIAAVLLVVLLWRFEGFSRALFVVHAMVLFLLVAGTRLLFRALTEARHYPANGRKALILGAGDAGELTARALRLREGEWVPLGYLDSSPAYRRRKILGAPVLGSLDDLERVVAEFAPDEVIVARLSDDLDLEQIVARCRRLDVPVSLAPVVREFRPL